MRAVARLALRTLLVGLLLLVGERAVFAPTRTTPVADASASSVRRSSDGRVFRSRRRPPRTTTTTAPPATAATTTAATTAPTTATTTAPTSTTVKATTTTAAATTTTVKPTTTTAKATTTTRAPTTTAAATTTAAPPTGGRFATLPAGAALPSGATCATQVKAAPEVRSMNVTYNATKGTRPNAERPRVTGDFTGTTDQIVQWAACKWGIDEDIARAQIAVESWWDMRSVGDNGESFGLGQVRTTAHPSAFVDDNAKRSAAYNLDYTYAIWRACMEGEFTWLNTVERGATYAGNDLWGCVGLWFSGRWHTPAAEGYIVKVKDYLGQRIWTSQGFLGYTG